MAKRLLNDFRLGGDIIDQVAGAEEPPPPNSGTTGPESRPAGDGGPDEAAVPPLPPFTKEGVFHVFRLGEITYRVGGVKPLFVTSLRVNIKATKDGMSYPDSLDLYVAKARMGYALALHRAWGAEPSRVEKDLVTILEALEEERDRNLVAGGRQEVVMSDAQRQAGLELLQDPALFDRIDADLSALGYVGESLNKQLMYLCASSRKLDDPISVLILSQSASGKSFLVECVRKLMPPEEVVAVTSLSDQALNYIDDLTHKFLVLGEAVHGEVVEHQIREMLSGKELSRLVTIKDAETGKMKSAVMRTPVIVASVMSGTSHDINPENASRAFLINTDESREQTKAIHESQRYKYSLDRLAGGGHEVASIINAHQAAQRLLRKVAIVNDFAPLLDFPTHLMRLRRDHDRFLDLIACVAFLRQYQKPAKRVGNKEYITCDLEDYRVAYRIMVEGVMASTMRELTKGAQILYQELRALARREAAKLKVAVNEVTLTQRMIREATGLGQTWVKENLRVLVEFEYLGVNRGGGERVKGFYRLREDAELGGVDLAMIPTPEQMAEKLTGGQTGRKLGAPSFGATGPSMQRNYETGRENPAGQRGQK
jgi:hypothetical protein